MPFTLLLQPHFTSAALSLPPSFLRDHVDLLLTSTVDAGYKHKELDRYARALWPTDWQRHLHALQVPGLRINILPRPGWQELNRDNPEGLLVPAQARAELIAAALAPLMDALPEDTRLIIPGGQVHPDHYSTALGALPWATHAYREWPSAAINPHNADPFWRKRLPALQELLFGPCPPGDGQPLFASLYGDQSRVCFDACFASQKDGYRVIDGAAHEDFRCEVRPL
jgi:hypothetical protein